MSLFDGYEMPADERALEILERISFLWDDNACVREACDRTNPDPSIYHLKVSAKIREMLIRLSVTDSKTLEDMLNEETSLHNILQYAMTAITEDW